MKANTSKRMVITFLLLFIYHGVFSQLIIQNNLTVPITFAIGWEETGNPNWTGMETKGWYTLYPGQTIEPGLYFSATDDHFFFYAKTLSGPFKEVTSGTKMLVHPTDAFDIKNCDMQYVKDQNPVYQWRMFKRRDVHFKKRQEKSVLFQITLSDIADAL